MCYAFISYYPVSTDFTLCLTVGDSILLCDENYDNMTRTFKKGRLGQCDMIAFTARATAMVLTVMMACDSSGKTCKPRCNATLASVRQDPCMQGDVGVFNTQAVDQKTTFIPDDGFVNALHSCDYSLRPETTTMVQESSSSRDVDSHQVTTGGYDSRASTTPKTSGGAQSYDVGSKGSGDSTGSQSGSQGLTGGQGSVAAPGSTKSKSQGGFNSSNSIVLTCLAGITLLFNILEV